LARYSASSSPSPRQWLAKSPGRLMRPHVCQVHALLIRSQDIPSSTSTTSPWKHRHVTAARELRLPSPLLSFPGSPSWYPCSCAPRACQRRARKFPSACWLSLHRQKISLLGVSIHHFSLPLQTSRDRQPCPGAQPRRHLPPPRRNRSGAHIVKWIVVTSGQVSPPSIPSSPHIIIVYGVRTAGWFP
jgi:hypothetical protein